MLLSWDDDDNFCHCRYVYENHLQDCDFGAVVLGGRTRRTDHDAMTTTTTMMVMIMIMIMVMRMTRVVVVEV